jgi:hypothetical protein
MGHPVVTTTTPQDGIVIDHVPLDTGTEAFLIDRAFGFSKVFCTLGGLPPGPAESM